MNFIGINRTNDCSNENTWKLIKNIDIKSSTQKITIDFDLNGNRFNCKEIIIVGKIVSNTSSRPMCKLNKRLEFSGVNSTYINGTRYIYDTFTIKGCFMERDMKYLNQDILENSILFDNGFFKVIKNEFDVINCIELYGDSSTFSFRSGTALEIYGRF